MKDGVIKITAGVLAFFVVYGSILLSENAKFLGASRYVGELKKADSYKDGKYYYVKEYFRYLRNDSNHTCVIENSHSYTTKKKASNAADEKKRGTTRQLWVSPKDSGDCIDNRQQSMNYLIVGTTFLSFFGLFCLLTISFFMIHGIPEPSDPPSPQTNWLEEAMKNDRVAMQKRDVVEMDNVEFEIDRTTV
jgi:hypothetical protein